MEKKLKELLEKKYINKESLDDSLKDIREEIKNLEKIEYIISIIHIADDIKEKIDESILNEKTDINYFTINLEANPEKINNTTKYYIDGWCDNTDEDMVSEITYLMNDIISKKQLKFLSERKYQCDINHENYHDVKNIIIKSLLNDDDFKVYFKIILDEKINYINNEKIKDIKVKI